MTTTAVPANQTSSPEGERAVSSPSNALSSTSERRETNILWREVLMALSAQPPQERKVRERRRIEATVSPETLARIEGGLIEAALVYGKAEDKNQVSPLASLAEVLKLINPNLDFKNEEQVVQAVKELMRRYPSQAVALGVAYSEMKLVALRKVYDYTQETISQVESPKPSTIPKVSEVIINPDGSVSFQERQMSYEEFIKTPEGQKEKGWWIFKRKASISQEEFEKLAQEVVGKGGRLKISISRKSSPSSPLEQFEFFLLDQLDLYSTIEDKLLDPANQEDFSYLFQEFQRAFLLRAEISRATGVPTDQIQTVFESFQQIEDIEFNQVAEIIINDHKEQAKKEIEKRQEALKGSQEASMKRILEQRREKLRDEIVELSRKKEEEKEKEQDILPDAKTVYQAIITSGLLSKEDQGWLFREGENGNILFQDLQVIEEGLEAQIDDIEVEIAGYGKREELVAEITHLMDQLTHASRTTQTKSPEGEPIVISPASEEVISMLREVLKQKSEQLANLNEALKRRTEAQKKLEKLRRLLKRTVTINNQTKTIREWIEEARKESELSATGDLESQINQKEKELAEITVLLEYFDEENIGLRAQRKEEVEGIILNWDEATAINPELEEIFSRVEDGEKSNILKTLYILFGDQYLFPKTEEDYERLRLINIFLKSSGISGICSNIRTVDLEQIDIKLRELRNTRVGEIRGGKKTKEENSGN